MILRQSFVQACAAAVLAATVLAVTMGAPLFGASPSPAGLTYRIELNTDIQEKPYKFFVLTAPVKASCSMDFVVKPGTERQEVSVKSLHYTWKTTGMDLEKEITPERVLYKDHGKAQIQWTPGQTVKGETNPLDIFGRPIALLSPGGREPGQVVRNPEKFVRFMSNFAFGQAVLLHRPPLPNGELKQGQTFTVDSELPDPTYSAVCWQVPVEWTVDSITGKEDEAIVQLTGATASTREKADGIKGLLTDGALNATSQVQLKLKTGELISGTTRLEIRWKKDPSGTPNGVMDYVTDCRIRESVREQK